MKIDKRVAHLLVVILLFTVFNLIRMPGYAFAEDALAEPEPIIGGTPANEEPSGYVGEQGSAPTGFVSTGQGEGSGFVSQENSQPSQGLGYEGTDQSEQGLGNEGTDQDAQGLANEGTDQPAQGANNEGADQSNVTTGGMDSPSDDDAQNNVNQGQGTSAGNDTLDQGVQNDTVSEGEGDSQTDTTQQAEGEILESITTTDGLGEQSANMLDGVDISGWNTGINYSKLGDFVIIKATEWNPSKNSYTTYNDYVSQAEKALAAGKLIGFYHFATSYDYSKQTFEQQAQGFINAITPYLGRAILCLDWENGEHYNSNGSSYIYSKLESDVSGAKRWLDYVYAQTGVMPFIYMNKNCSNNYDWSSVANAGYELWGAQYLNKYYNSYSSYKNKATGFVDDPELRSGWGAWGRPTIYQYTSTATLHGNKQYDVNKFYGTRADWERHYGNPWKQSGNDYYYEVNGVKKTSSWIVTPFTPTGSYAAAQRYWVDATGKLAMNRLVDKSEGSGYYAWAGANGAILRGKWDNGAGRVYVADNDGRLIGNKLTGNKNAWVVTADFDGHLERYWVDAKTHAAISGFFTVPGYGDSFGMGGQGFVYRGDFAFGGRFWSADNDGRLRTGWHVTSGFGQGLQRYYMGDSFYGSPHAAAVGRLIDPKTDESSFYAWATDAGYVLRGKWDNGHGRVYAADNDGKLIGNKIGNEDGWVVTADYDGRLERYWVDHVTRAAVSGFFTVDGYGDSFGMGGHGYVVRGALPFMGKVVLADNDGKLPSKAGFVVTNKYGQGLQRYYVEKIFGNYLGAKPGYSESGFPHYTTDAGYVLRGQKIYVAEKGTWLTADNDGRLQSSEQLKNAVIEKYLAWALAIANDESHGYSQYNRWGPDYDCSSLVIAALKAVGLDTGNATYTGNMRAELAPRGWTVIQYNGKVNSLVRGDILLHDQNHTEFYLGNNQRVGAHEDEKGGIGQGAKTGDQTGKEICVRDGVGTWFTWVLRLAA